MTDFLRSSDWGAAFVAFCIAMAAIGVVLYLVGGLRKNRLLKSLGGPMLVSGVAGWIFGWLGLVIALLVVPRLLRGGGRGDGNDPVARRPDEM
jgi:hypothetical protein